MKQPEDWLVSYDDRGYEQKGMISLSPMDVPLQEKKRKDEFMTDVFVSYARKDLKRVEPIVTALQTKGWSVFWDLEIPPGETWRGYIKKRLDESRCVLVVWSQRSINSHWVMEEADEALKRGILVPVRLDDVNPPFGFTHIHAADLTDWNNNGSHPQFQQCVDAITSRLSPPDQPSESAQRSTISPATTTILLHFNVIRAGLFTMGSPESEVGRGADENQHQVQLTEFYMSKYAVTVAEFRKFVETTVYRTDEVSSYGVSGSVRPSSEDNHPVVHVSWNDAVAYCKWLSETTGKTYRLPTEAEREYACRAGTTMPFNTGENLTTAQANYDGDYPYNNNPKGQYRENTVPVKSFAPNAWGLYTMHGNVLEWCSDWYGEKYYDECKAKGVVENPLGPETGSYRVLRGGCWLSLARYCRSANRSYLFPGSRDSYIGFRLVFVP